MNQTLARLRKVSPSLSCLFWADIKVTQQLLIWERPDVGMITTASLLTLSEMCFVSYEWLDSVRWLLLLAWAFGTRTRWEFSIDINTQAWIKWFKPSSVSISSTAFDWQDFDLHNLFLHPHQSATWDMNWQSWSLWEVANSPEGTRLIVCGVWTHTRVSAFSLAKGPFWSPCYGSMPDGCNSFDLRNTLQVDSALFKFLIHLLSNK